MGDAVASASGEGIGVGDVWGVCEAIDDVTSLGRVVRGLGGVVRER